MNKACFFFKFSDLTRHFPRNYKRYPDVRKIPNYVYDDRYGKYTRADLLFVPGRETYPVIVNVHGGGFVKGAKAHRTAFCSEMAREGYFVYNINYRLAPQYAFPAAILDVVTALNKLPDLREEYALDLSRVILTGDSAGGFYSLAAVCCTYNAAFRDALGIPAPIVKPTAFMGFCGAYRLEDLLLMKTPLNVSYDIADALFGGKYHGNAEALRSAPYFALTDLVRYVNADFPNAFLMYSTHDSFCGGQGELLSARLKENGVPVTEHIATGEKDAHCFHLFPFHSSTPAVMASLRAFLRS